MNDTYQLILSVDQDFQTSVDQSLGRLTSVAGVRRRDGRLEPIRASKKRIAHAGIMALDSLSLAQLTTLSMHVKVIDKKEAPDYIAKHRAVEVQKRFARMARLKSASLALRFNFHYSTRHFIHYGIASLTEQTDSAFQALIHQSIHVENGDALRQFAFYQTPKSARPQQNYHRA